MQSSTHTASAHLLAELQSPVFDLVSPDDDDAKCVDDASGHVKLIERPPVQPESTDASAAASVSKLPNTRNAAGGAAGSKRGAQGSLDAFFSGSATKKLKLSSASLPEWLATGSKLLHDPPQLETGSGGLHSVPAVAGLYLCLDFITMEEENRLVRWLDDMDTNGTQPWRQNGVNGVYRKKSWGYIADFSRRIVRSADESRGEPLMPEELLKLGSRIKSIACGSAPTLGALLRDFEPNESNANEYFRTRGDVLTPHFDDRFLFGNVLACLSLVQGCTMTFHPHPSGKRGGVKCYGCCACGREPRLLGVMPQTKPEKVYLPRRSLLLATGSSRYDYTHGIATEDLPAAGRRISVIFRQAKCGMPHRK
mmetsp:Transcript_54407/g.100520  ORF Transcript_54407/g.100520 Transcript_54407/m.100520 type:complete len:366 (+) Transcript_54407:142-1239(+)